MRFRDFYNRSIIKILTSSERMSCLALKFSEGFSGMDKTIEIQIRFETLYFIAGKPLEINQQISMSLFYC
jgi:hypothetical protein